MGRVLLAHLDEGALAEYMAATELRQLTPSTVHDEAQLRRVLDTTRAQGYAVVDQELEQGLRSVAAPVRADAERVVAAVNVSVHASRATVTDIKQRLLPPLLDAVGKISADLGSIGSAALARR
jgi:IclR family pca regulon transcriptional regulator